MDNNSLNHYGIPGMRWGVRRTKAQLRRARGPDKPRKVTKEVYEAEKKKALDSGDPKKVKAWQSKLTNQELRQAIERCELAKRIDTINDGEKRSGLQKVEAVMSKVGRVTNVINTGTNAYNAVARINNTFNKKRVPVIGEKSKQDKNDN